MRRDYTPLGEARPPRRLTKRTCTECHADFEGHSLQQRCDSCRLFTCPQCGLQMLTKRRRMLFCSQRCKGLYQTDVLANLQAHRGVKPRTYAARHRDKHGGAEDRDWRVAVFERDDYTCQDCGQRGGRLQAHHIKPYKAYPELRHVLANGLTLCVDCHKKTDSFGWSGYWHKKNAARRLQQSVMSLEAV